MSQNDISNDEFSMEMERIYMNSMQVMVNLLEQSGGGSCTCVR